MRYLSVPKLWAVSAWLLCMLSVPVHCDYLKRLLKHNYSKLTIVDHNMCIIWTYLEVQIHKSGLQTLLCAACFNPQTAVMEELYQIWSMWIRCESSWAKLWGWCVWFTYFQVCTGPSQTWIHHSISSWKKKKKLEALDEETDTTLMYV